jgi:hypothetical protein
VRTVAKMQSALDDIAGGIEELEEHLDLEAMDAKIRELEAMIEAAQNAADEAEDSDDDEEDEDSE